MQDSQARCNKPLPLEGIRVLDFSGLLPGPFATQMLSEFGADVLKVEQPSIGDASRHNHPRFRSHSIYFNLLNGNKTSITLDLTRPKAREIVTRIVGEIDVVVEGYRPGVAAKLGVDYKTLAAINPRLVYCSISGFGQTGSLAHIAGHDLVVQAMAGVLGAVFDGEHAPPMPSFQSADYAGALLAIIAIQAALAQRARTGEGCEIDVSMFDALFMLAKVALTPAFGRLAGFSGEPRAEVYGRNPRYATYLSKDGKAVAVALLEKKSWHTFCKSIGRLDLVSADETPEHRLTSHELLRDSYHDALSTYCASHTWAELMKSLHDTGIAICPVCSPDEALALDHVRDRGLVGFIDHPIEGRIPEFVNPLARAGLARAGHRPAPSLGQNTDEILSGLGYTDHDIAVLRREGAV